jgi:putative lipoic acid-binding regulatory protein
MDNHKTIETILKKIEDESIKLVAEHALETSRKALDMTPSSRVRFVADEIDMKMPKALKLRGQK